MADRESLRVPNEFVPGTPAKALEVNEDMEYILDCIAAPSTDGVTVTTIPEDANKLKAIGLREHNMDMLMQPYYCTLAEYQQLESNNELDDYTFYVIEDDVDTANTATINLDNLSTTGEDRLNLIKANPFTAFSGNVDTLGYADLLYTPTEGTTEVTWSQPIMSSNTTWGTLASSQGSAYLGFDGNTSTYITTPNGWKGTVTITWVMPEQIKLTRCTVTAPTVSERWYSPTQWRVYRKNVDTKQWVHVGTKTTGGRSDYTWSYTINLTQMYAYETKIEIDCSSISWNFPTKINEIRFDGVKKQTVNGHQCFLKVGGAHPYLKCALSDRSFITTSLPSIDFNSKWYRDRYNFWVDEDGLEVLCNYQGEHPYEPELVRKNLTILKAQNKYLTYSGRVLTVKAGTEVYIPDGRDSATGFAYGQKYVVPADLACSRPSIDAVTTYVFLTADGRLFSTHEANVKFVQNYGDMPVPTAGSIHMCYVESENVWYVDSEDSNKYERILATHIGKCVYTTTAITSVSMFKPDGARCVWLDNFGVPATQKIFNGMQWEDCHKVLIGTVNWTNSGISSSTTRGYTGTGRPRRYMSPLYRLTAGTALNIEHNLNLEEDERRDARVITYLRCDTASDGYAVGDILRIDNSGFTNSRTVASPIILKYDTALIPTPNSTVRCVSNAAGTNYISSANVIANFSFGIIIEW